MRSIPDDMWAMLDRLIDAGVLCWAVTIELATTAIYVTNAKHAITRNSQTYLPIPFTVSPMSDSADGNLPSSSLVVTNVGRWPMPILESRAYNEAPVLVESHYEPKPNANLFSFKTEIRSAVASDPSVTFDLGPHPCSTTNSRASGGSGCSAAQLFRGTGIDDGDRSSD